MYKNKTLKGLAISAVVALGFSGLAAAPASANYGQADKTFVSIAPSAGDEWTVLADGDFQVTVNKAATLTVGTLKLLVEDVSRQVTSPTASTAVTASPSAWAATSTESDNVVRKSATDGSYVMAVSASSAVTGAFTISAKATDPFSASSVIKVTAWNDANGNGIIDSTEYASPTETITFLDADSVALNVTMVRPKVGESNLSALVSTTPTLNHEQGAVLNKATPAQGFDVVFNRAGFATTTSYAGALAWDEDDRNYTATSSALSAGAWSITRSTEDKLNGGGAASNSSVSIAVKGTAIFTTSNSHDVSVGDGFSFTTSALAATRATVSKIISATSFEAALASTVTATTSGAVSTTIQPSSYVSVYDKVTPGAYGVVGKWKGAFGTKSEFATQAVLAAEVVVDVAASAAVSGVANFIGERAAATASVKVGTLTVDVIATVLDEDGDAVGAGRVVTVTNHDRSTDVRVNGKTGTDTLLTDANGQVKVTVTSTAGASTAGVGLTFNAENAVTSGVTLDWVAQAFSLKDMSVANTDIATSRSIVAGSSYVLDLAVADQWFASPAATDTYRVVVTGTGAVNAIVPVTAGKAQITIGDNGISKAYSTTLTLQKAGTTGVFANVSGGAVTIDTFVATGAVTLGANDTLLYKVADATKVKLSSAVAAKALVEADLRTETVAIPAYANNAYIAGVVKNATTGVAVAGAVVTVTGPSNMLFNVGNVYKRGSITVVADTSGEFAAKVFSTTAQKDTVVTVTALGNSATTKLTFTGIGVGEGTSLVITAPDTVEPASTVQVKAKLSDVYGNAVTAAAGRLKVTYTGPGIIFGTLPTATDTAGELMFSALLGAADKGSITVVVSYDQNGDGDFVDAKDLNTTKTITVGAAAVAAPSADQKVNAGSFKGFVAVYAKGYKGQRLSAKIGNDWVIVNSLASDFVRVTDFTGAGVDITVKIYIDRVEVASIPLTTK